jgi:DNA-binding NtrC family response regulator
VADDEPSIVSSLRDALAKEGYSVFTAAGGEEACETAEREQVHVALVDLVMQDLSGLVVMKRIREKMPTTRVIIMTAYATVETAVEVMKQGALDYLIKPFSMDELKMQIRRALNETALARENLVLKMEIERRVPAEDFIGESPAIREALELTARTAGSDTTVLVLGETGTGKELIARALHRTSKRSEAPFIAINCGAIPESLLERELFGHEKGAFTGADSTRPGLLEAASDGTLFLDEISEMPPPLQVKLLRVLEGHEYLRVGGTRPIKSRARFVAATNKDPDREAAEGRFRRDLYYRLNVISIKLPPLRERGGDVRLLAEYFLKHFVRVSGRRLSGFSPDAMRTIMEYPWPGNVRELKNVIERAVLLSDKDEIDEQSLRLSGPAGPVGDPAKRWTTLQLREARAAFEREYLAEVLKECHGNVSQTAARIGLDRRNLQTRIKKYKLKTAE